MPTPSPLSRVAGRRHWTEDEGEEREYDDEDEDEASPSPGSTSTDAESTDSNPPRRRRKSSSSLSNSKSRRRAKRIKSRSRSSTVASLVVPHLARQQSSSSIRTVTAGEVSFREDGHALKKEDTFRDVRGGVRTQAQAQAQSESEFGLDPVVVEGNGAVAETGETQARTETEDVDLARLTDRLLEVVRTDEKRFRELAWDALREALEEYADEVCVFMCVLL